MLFDAKIDAGKPGGTTTGYFGNLQGQTGTIKLSELRSVLPMKRHFSAHKDNEVRDLVPNLLRSAADPKTDAVGRTWLFDALRELTGRNLADDVASWTKWYASAYGAKLSTNRPDTNLEEFIAACPWLPHGVSY